VRQVLARLVSTKTLVRVAFTTLSLLSMASAFGQGLPAGTMAPVYGSTWAAAQAQSHSLNAQNVASEPSKTPRAEAPRTPDNKIRLVSHRTGG
jgi:hypothetical protein